jgi:hypothetical protein
VQVFPRLIASSTTRYVRDDVSSDVPNSISCWAVACDADRVLSSSASGFGKIDFRLSVFGGRIPARRKSCDIHLRRNTGNLYRALDSLGTDIISV